MRNAMLWAALAALGLAACDEFYDRHDDRPVPVTVRHENGRPAADVKVELLGAKGDAVEETRTDINGAAAVHVETTADRMRLRIDGRYAFLDVPSDEATVVLPGEAVTPRTVSVTFRPVLPAGDTWFQVLYGAETAYTPLSPGDSLTLRMPAEPRNFFVASGDVTQGVLHAGLVSFDGGGDAVFTDPITDPYTDHAQKVEVSIDGLAEAPTCLHQALPRLDHQTGALIYPMSATGFTVYSFSSVQFRFSARTLGLPNGLACTYTAPAGDCIGKPVTALVPLVGSDTPVHVDWTTTTLVPVAGDDYTIVSARLTNPKASQTYSRDKAGFCMAVNDFTDLSFVTAELEVPAGLMQVERFMAETPDTIELLGGVDPVVRTYDTADTLELAAACENCYDVARVSGRDEAGDPVVAYAPVSQGLASVPRALFARRNLVELYGYANAYGYADAVTLPMQGYGIRPGESGLVPYSPRTTFYLWRSER